MKTNRRKSGIDRQGRGKLELEHLEGRLLLNGDWTGVWTLEGLYQSGKVHWDDASYVAKVSKEKLTITALGGDAYNLNVVVDHEVKNFAMTDDGAGTLAIHDYYYHEDYGEYVDDHIELIEIQPDIALVMGGEGGNGWGDTLAGVATRGKFPTVTREWVGEYQVDEYLIEKDAWGDMTFEQISDQTMTITQTGKSEYQVVIHQGDGADEIIEGIKPKGNTFIKDHYEEEDDWGNTLEGYTYAMRGPGDWLYAYGGEAEYYPGSSDGYLEAWVMICRPLAGYEYQSDLTCRIDGDDVPASLMAGESFNLPVTVINDGSAPAKGKFDINIYAEGEETVLIGQLSGGSLNLKGESSKDYKVKVELPAAMDHDIYSIWAQVETDSAIYESSLENNSSMANNPDPIELDVAEAHVDLTGSVDLAKLPDDPIGGDKAKISVDIQNLGNVAVNGSMNIDLFLSSDDVWDENDVLMASTESAKIRLKPGQEKAVNISTTLPVGVETDDYYVLARINSPVTIEESDYANNILMSDLFSLEEGTVNLTGEILESSVKLLSNNRMKFSMIVENTGNVALKATSDIQLIFRDNSGELPDYVLESRDNVKFSLKPDKAKRYTFKVTLPGDDYLGVADYSVIGEIDTQNLIAESSEEDNIVEYP